MSSSMQPQYEEKRFALRMALRLPIVVSGRSDDGAAWSEPTETDDISTLGALFQLNQKIASGDTLYIRSHRPDGVPVEVKAQVVRLSRRKPRNVPCRRFHCRTKGKLAALVRGMDSGRQYCRRHRRIDRTLTDIKNSWRQAESACRNCLMSSYETITVETEGRVAVITINRPDKLNALNSKVHVEGVAALDGLRKDDSVRVVVLTGAGEKSFVAGADISEFEGKTPVTQRATFQERTLFNTIDSFPKPVIAMVNGFCLGGGNELALACDLRVCSDNARFSQPEINLGIIPGGGGTQRLTRLVGEGRSMEMVLTGDMIDAETAHRFGLVNHVYPAQRTSSEDDGARCQDRRKSSYRPAARQGSRQICVALEPGRRPAARGGPVCDLLFDRR